MKSVQNNLRHYRELKGLTQWDVAQQLGFKSTDRISKWENGKMFPHARNLFRLAKLFEVSVDKFYAFD